MYFEVNYAIERTTFSTDDLLFLRRWRSIRWFLSGSHPIHGGIVATESIETAVKPAQPPSDSALLLCAIALPHSGIPRGVVRHISGELDHRTRRCSPVNERRAVCADDALRELGDDRVGELCLATLPNVRSAVW